MKDPYRVGFPGPCTADNLMLRLKPDPHVKYAPSQTPIGYVLRGVKLGPPAKRPKPPQ